MSSSKVKTGVKGLDIILGGGLEVPSNILIFGSPMCGKRPLLMELMYNGMKQGIPSIYVLTDFGYTDWKRMMENTGENVDEYEKKGMVHVIDCYSKQFNMSIKDNAIVSYADSSTALSSISLKISRAADALCETECPMGFRVGFHSLSTLFETLPASSVFKFIQFIIGKFRNSGATVFFVIEKGMHDDKTVTMVRHLMDGVIEFEDDKIFILGVIGADKEKHNYKISADGFEFFPSMDQLAKIRETAEPQKNQAEKNPEKTGKMTLESFAARHLMKKPAETGKKPTDAGKKPSETKKKPAETGKKTLASFAAKHLSKTDSKTANSRNKTSKGKK